MKRGMPWSNGGELLLLIVSTLCDTNAMAEGIVLKEITLVEHLTGTVNSAVAK